MIFFSFNWVGPAPTSDLHPRNRVEQEGWTVSKIILEKPSCLLLIFHASPSGTSQQPCGKGKHGGCLWQGTEKGRKEDPKFKSLQETQFCSNNTGSRFSQSGSSDKMSCLRSEDTVCSSSHSELKWSQEVLTVKATKLRCTLWGSNSYYRRDWSMEFSASF